MKNGKIVQLLNRFNSISETEMKNAKKARTLEEYNLDKNMYISVWLSLSLGPKREIKTHREEIGRNGPPFLWYLFKYYHSTSEQTV